jgi:hypothetical protein
VGDDDLRGTFERLRAAPMPVRALTADDVIRSGEAVRRRRRTIAVVGSGVGTTAVVVAALVVLVIRPGSGPTAPVDPAGPSVSTSTSPSVTSGAPEVSPTDVPGRSPDPTSAVTTVPGVPEAPAATTPGTSPAAPVETSGRVETSPTATG